MDSNILCLAESMLEQRLHHPSGPVYKSLLKRIASMCLPENELKGIYSLTESHAPTMRIKTTYRYDKISQAPNNEHKSMDKRHIEFNCPRSINDEINGMINKIQEMPAEWTIVQLTTQFNLQESCQVDLSRLYTDPLHVTVFDCGQLKMNPFCVTTHPPKDVNGDTVQLCKEMRAIIEENRNVFHTFIGKVPVENITVRQKRLYAEHRSLINERLKNVVKQLEKNWLGEWRFLLIGKIVDGAINKLIEDRIGALSREWSSEINEKTKYLIKKLVVGSAYMSSSAVMKVIQQNVASKDLRSKVNKLVTDLSNQHNFKQVRRHPVILIIDEKLDCFPWEMLDILVDHPVSRMPSLHFTHALFKEHEGSIVNGYKQVPSTKGTYVINPGLDLKRMEVRLKNFFNFWLPEWNGLVGIEPTSDQFSELLNGGDIFVYNGHGSGIQFLSGSRIQHMRVDSVVFLFGCSSVRMSSAGPHVEMNDVFHNYMIACSPCVVGMLWEVTDFDTDIFSTELLSRWLPSKSKPHWSHIDKSQWQKGTIVTSEAAQKTNVEEFEPELLRAINMARKAPSQYLTKGALVARGLPVKLVAPQSE